MNKERILRITFITGIVALLAGAIDPLEGSVVILAGSFLIALSAWLQKDRHRKFFLVLFLMIFFGVFFIWFFSAKGGIGGDTGLSMWWGMLMMPYPLAWLVTIILLIVRAAGRKKVTAG